MPNSRDGTKRLVFSRRNRERFYIGDALVRVEWFPGRGNLIRVTVDAPPDVLILREELHDRGPRTDKDHD